MDPREEPRKVIGRAQCKQRLLEARLVTGLWLGAEVGHCFPEHAVQVGEEDEDEGKLAEMLRHMKERRRQEEEDQHFPDEVGQGGPGVV